MSVSVSPRLAAQIAKHAVRAREFAKRNRAIIKEVKTAVTRREVAKRFGLHESTVRQIFAAVTGHPAPYAARALKCHYVPRRRSTAYLVKRALAIVEARRRGVTLRALADQYGVTPERIRSVEHAATRRDYVGKLLRKAKTGKRRRRRCAEPEYPSKQMVAYLRRREARARVMATRNDRIAREMKAGVSTGSLAKRYALSLPHIRQIARRVASSAPPCRTGCPLRPERAGKGAVAVLARMV